METPENLSKAVRGFRITIATLAAGIVMFAAVVAYLQTQNGGFAQDLKFVTYLGAAMLAGAIASQFFILPITDAAVRKNLGPSNDNAKWYAAWGTRMVMGCALIEGAAFMCLIGAMMDGLPFGLILGLLGAALMFVFHWPTENKLREYADRQREIATMVRSGG